MIQVDDRHSRIEVLMSGQNQAHELIARCFSETECGERKLDVLLYSEINAGGYRLVGGINLEEVGNRPVHNRIRVEIYYALHIGQKLGKHKPHVCRAAIFAVHRNRLEAFRSGRYADELEM